jgi:hypothetical protein
MNPPLFTTHIAGVQFTRFADADLQIGKKVELIPEPQNPYDGFAIRVECDEIKIGYIPRGINFQVLVAMKEGKTLNTVIDSLNLMGPAKEKIIVNIYEIEK